MTGVVRKVTAFRPLPASFVDAAGMLPTAIWSAGTLAVRSKVAL
jgi:hypothetical protein